MHSLLPFARSKRGAVWSRLLLSLALLVIAPLWLWSQAPEWWTQRGVIDPSATSDDYAAVNQGQVKHIAKQAYEELADKLPNGPGAELDALWAAPAASTDDYQAINIGQLKNVAKPFYDRLIAEGVSTAYPWGAATDDYALANIGQVKNLFSFSLNSLSQDYYIMVVSGNNQVGESGHFLAKPVKILLVDQNGMPLAARLVTFAVSSAGGQVASDAVGSSAATTLGVTTDLLGYAHVYVRPVGAAGDFLIGSAVMDEASVGFIAHITSDLSNVNGVGQVPSPPNSEVVTPGGGLTGNPASWESLEFLSPNSADFFFSLGDPVSVQYDVDSPRIYWVRPAAGADGFVLERRADYGQWIECYRGNATSFADSGLLSGRLYEYRLRVVKGGVMSAPVEKAYAVPSVKGIKYRTAMWNSVTEEYDDWAPEWDYEGTYLDSDWASFMFYWSNPNVRYEVHFTERAHEGVPRSFMEVVSGVSGWWGVKSIESVSNDDEVLVRPEKLWMGYDGYHLEPVQAGFKIKYRGALVPWYAIPQGGLRLNSEEALTVSVPLTNAYIPYGDENEDIPYPDYVRLQYSVAWSDEDIEVYKVTGDVAEPVSSGVVLARPMYWEDPYDHEYLVIRRKADDFNARTVRFTLTPSMSSLAAYGTTIDVGIGTGEDEGANIPLSESSGAKYRKIALNGAPLSDEKPQQEAESDQAREETFIDALTLGLRHDTTDTYMAVPAADLFLGARRSITSEIWTDRRGMRPSERPDRPFGTGWTSNLAAGIQFTRMLGSAADAIQNPDTATVTDENGATYSFAILYGADATYSNATGYSGSVTFVPLPTSKHEQSTHLTTLTKNGSNYIFKRKFGSTLTYEMSELKLALPSDRIDGSSSGEENSWARLASVEDRYGNALDYAYDSAYSLVPATIKVRRSDGQGATLSIRQNASGLITDIWDPMGYKVSYTYASVGDTHQLTSVTASDGKTTAYAYTIYEEVRDVPASVDTHDSEPKFHFNLTQITDPLNHSYSFAYDYDETKYDYTSSPDLGGALDGQNYYIKAGVPMYVTKVTLPNGDFSEFDNSESDVRLVRNETTDVLEFSGTRRNRVTDAEGNERVYDFTNTQVEEMENFASIYHKQEKFDVPRMIYYRTMAITSYQGAGAGKTLLGAESFTFDPASGMSVASATDFSGNTTTYAYDDVFTNTLFTDAGAGSTLYGRYSDPTSQTNALNKTKHFTYGTSRIMTSSTDEVGVKTQWTVDTLGRRTEEQVFPDGSTTAIQHTVFTYGNTDFPNFMTKKTVKKLATATDDPTWVKDLVTLYVPDANGRVVQEAVDMNENGTVDTGTDLITATTYDANGNKLTTTDPRGNVTTFSYDKRNRLTHVTYADAHQKRFYYDDRGNKIREEDENDVATLWDYDVLNRVTRQAVDMNGNGAIDPATDLVTSYTYNALNAKLTTANPNGTVTKFEYDALQRLTTKTDDFGGLNYVTTYEYGANSGGSVFNSSGFKPTKVTDPRAYTTEVTYDDLYRPTSEKIQYGSGAYALTAKAYDDVGNLTQITAPAATVNGTLQSTGTITHTDYDALRRPVTVKEAFGLGLEVVSRTDYTSTGFAWKTIADYGDATHLNRTATTEYDQAGRPVKVYAPAVDDALTTATTLVTPVTETRYDAAGNVSYVINPLGARTDYTYDNRNRRQTEELPAVTDATTTTASRPIRTTAYDGVGSVIAVQDARGFITTTEYDPARRPVSVTAPPVTLADGTTVYPETTSTYDSAGNVLTVTDANGHVTTNTYDALNRLKTSLQKPDLTNPAHDILVTNEYDAAGNRTAVIDGKSQRTEFTYDGLNRNLTVKDPANRTVTFTYDALNKVARTDSLGQHTDYVYDARHRLTDVSYVGRTQDNRTYAYDLLGQLLGVTEAGKPGNQADVAYTYDALGRQLTETSGGKQHAYAYDLANNRVKVTYGGTGTVLTSTYDTQNRLQILSEQPASGSPRITTYGYDLNGNRVLLALPNGEETDAQYDPLNRAVAITTSKASGAVLLQLTQAYDPVGNLTGLTERHYGSTLAPRTVTNTYDAVNRLRVEVNAETGSASKTIATTYGFDRANNRTSKAVATTTGSGTSLVETAYVYNNLNQLQTATEGATVTGFTYDLNGNRATRTKAGQTETYAYDYENRLFSLTDALSSGSSASDYAYTYDYRTRRVERTEAGVATKSVFSGGVSVSEYTAVTLSPLAYGPSPDVEYIRGSDWGGGVGGLLYSVRSGVPSFKHYNSRGDVISATNAAGAATWQGTYEAYGTRTQETGTTADRQKANTKEEDPTGLLNEGFRYRDLETGVFITRDPLGFVDGPNMYAYVVQNPWSKFDPKGLEWKDIWGGIQSGFMQGAVAYERQQGADSLAFAPRMQFEYNQDTAEVQAAVRQGAIQRTGADTTTPQFQASEAITFGATAAAPTLVSAAGAATLPSPKTENRKSTSSSPPSAQEATEINAGNKQLAADTAPVPTAKPTEAYNRKEHYGSTPTKSDRKALGAGSDEVVDHTPPLVKRYYEGDPATGEKPGFQQTPAEREASAKDRSRMQLQSKDESNQQGGKMSKYSKEKKEENGL